MDEQLISFNMLRYIVIVCLSLYVIKYDVDINSICVILCGVLARLVGVPVMWGSLLMVEFQEFQEFANIKIISEF